MMKNSRLTNRYGPGGNAGLVSGIAKARSLTSASFIFFSVREFLLPREIVNAHAELGVRRFQQVEPCDPAPYVFEARGPQFVHRRAREIVVLRLRRILEPPVDEVRDRNVSLVAEF